MDSWADYHQPQPQPQRTTSINSSSTPATTTTTTTAAICFTSCVSSSSSMKLSSSKPSSILSPAHARDAPPPPLLPSAGQISLSTSLSRRLRASSSVKGGGQASPMFPSSGKKRAGLENPEPSSPKVTCIGQVRVKTKKQGKKLRTRSKRQGEMSFRKLELSRSGHHTFPPLLNGNPECLPQRNQRWVHFPVTICEALRTFGADWNCLLPCRPSCTSSKEEKAVAMTARSGDCGGNSGSSCGAVIARWLVAVHEGEGRGRREIELVIGGEEAPAEINERSRGRRRHVFEGIVFNDEDICRERKEAEEEEKQGSVSICIPPKNALLLMRCRSDPAKMAALANRFCGPPFEKDEEDERRESEDDFQKDGINNGYQKAMEGVAIEHEMDVQKVEAEVSKECWVDAEEANEEPMTVEEESSSEVEEEEEREEEIVSVLLEESTERPEEKEAIQNCSGNDSPLAHKDESINEEEEQVGEAKAAILAENDNIDGVVLDTEVESTPEEANRRDTEIIATGKLAPELEDATPENPEAERDYVNPAMEAMSRDMASREPVGLPDCLLLMMCEPKLSMEVSKETWVCSTDFIRWLPQRHVNKAAAPGDRDEDPKDRATGKVTATNTKQPASPALTAQQTRILQQPPRSSCSFPSQEAATAAKRGGGESMAGKMRNAKTTEPLALTRCRSEPRRMAINLVPDACFWKNRKLEPHRPSADHLRVKAAGLGF
ncbi:hypothetical protein SAY87_010810 [Trapa incisa]|uniref:Uncharacterized protein n=1 Tax=Trapa incisa TaxID=236973 RepID=A0AAN7GQ13_9MYRT|nr:hypothetical protein SAY87_010810 [Trapa incisa]